MEVPPVLEVTVVMLLSLLITSVGKGPDVGALVPVKSWSPA